VPILTIKHVTTYHYMRPVAFGEHRMMLRPRDDDDQKVLESELEITPAPSHLSWTQDVFGQSRRDRPFRTSGLGASDPTGFQPSRFSSSGSLAMLAAIRRASSR
jgi:hypothetical protein